MHGNNYVIVHNYKYSILCIYAKIFIKNVDINLFEYYIYSLFMQKLKVLKIVNSHLLTELNDIQKKEWTQ